MRTVIFIILLCLAYIPANSQVTDRVNQAEQIKAAVNNHGVKSKTPLKITLWNLMELEGRVIYIFDDSFAIENTNKKFQKKMYTVNYGDVLELEIKKVFISFFPDETQRPFGKWEDVRQLKPGDSIQIELEEEKTVHGVFYESTDTKLTLLSGNKTFEFDREKILRVFRLWEQPSTMGKIRKGASKGVKVAESIEKNMPQIRVPVTGPNSGSGKRKGASPEGKAIGAVIGAGVGAVKPGNQKRLLVFAK